MSPPSEDDLAKVRRIAGHSPLDQAAVCTGVEVTGACAPLVGRAPLPALAFTFTHTDGTELTPIVLVLSTLAMHDLAEIVHEQVHRAIGKTAQIRRLS
jgi:hypothetical protein